MKPVRLRSTLLALTLALPSAAVATVYECETNSRSGGFIQDRIFIELNQQSGKATVLDAMINHIYKKPISAQTKKRSETSWRIKWRVEDVQLRNGQATFSMNAVLNLSRMAISLTGDLSGYDNNIHGNGTCKVVNR